MPLPAALLAKLKKRGIVTEEEAKPSAAPDEEVIAESYDDDAAEPEEERNTGCESCPNRSNVFHRCTQFCFERWGGEELKKHVDPDVDRRRLRMLRNHPLPPKWEEVFDVATSRYYYWNTDTDEVSWLSPTHPKAVITQAAGKTGAVQSREKRSLIGPSAEGDDEESGNESSSSDSQDEEKTQRKKGRFGRRSPPADVLDPMDPAAYSEAPRGTWSSGLERGDEAKTGVDTTASGPLFQMRPYPAPGAILRKNQEKRK